MSIGIWQVVLVLAIILIIFGAGKLPSVMGDLAKGVKNFKKGVAEEEKKSAPVAAKVPTVKAKTAPKKKAKKKAVAKKKAPSKTKKA